MSRPIRDTASATFLEQVLSQRTPDANQTEALVFGDNETIHVTPLQREQLLELAKKRKVTLTSLLYSTNLRLTKAKK